MQRIVKNDALSQVEEGFLMDDLRTVLYLIPDFDRLINRTRKGSRFEGNPVIIGFEKKIPNQQPQHQQGTKI